MKKVAVIASASGCGKTTVGRELAARLDAPFVELDALHHGPGWKEATADELRARVAPLVAGERWVIDGGYRGKLGDLVLEAADVVVWLDLPRRVWLPRLVRRSIRRIARREQLWAGNRESVRGAFVGRDALVPYALRTFRARRRRYPDELARFRVVRLRSQREIDAWLASVPQPELTAARGGRQPGRQGPLDGR
jgi:adenylate kinase family enzyme